MEFDRIDSLVTKEDFYFQAWDDRYSKGVWAALGVWDNQVDIVRDLSSAGDFDMIPAMDYVFSADWLPYVTGPTLAKAMQKLEERLALIPQDQLRRNSQWAHLVTQSVEALYAASSGRSRDGNPPKSLEHLPPLPATFELAVGQVDKTERNKGATNAK